MRINVRKIIDMWNNKNYSSDERSKELLVLLNHYNNIKNYVDLGFLTINIHLEQRLEIRDICVRC